MDHAPCPPPVVARTINALSVKQRKRGHSAGVYLHVPRALAPPEEVGEEEPFRYQEIKAVEESFLHGVGVDRGFTYAVVRILRLFVASG
jgi:hypothetical protein